MGLIHTEVHNVMKNNKVGQEEARLRDRAQVSSESIHNFSLRD